AARAIDLRPGDGVLKASEPDKGRELTEIKHDLATRTFDAAELARRVRKLGKEALVLEVNRIGARPGDAPATVTAPARGFDWGDVIVGMTDPAKPASPFEVRPLPPYPGNPGGDARDPFE